jgi:hypothetical protein
MPIALVIGSPFPKPSVLHVCSFVRRAAATILLPVTSRMYVRMLNGPVFRGVLESLSWFSVCSRPQSSLLKDLLHIRHCR